MTPRLFWGFNSEDAQWQALPASPLLIPAFIFYLVFGLYWSRQHEQEIYQKLNLGWGKELGLRRVQIREILARGQLDSKTIHNLNLDLLEIDRQFQSLL